MRALTKLSLVLLLLSSGLSLAQFGQQGRFGRQGRSAIPQAQTPPKEPEAKTADQIVDEQMPNISENLELDPFEEAVVRSTLVKYVQKRMELQILKLEPEKMREEYEKLAKLQDEEIKAGLPEDKYKAYMELQKNRFKTKKKKKKKKKSKS
jgi:hypothetical protein